MVTGLASGCVSILAFVVSGSLVIQLAVSAAWLAGVAFGGLHLGSRG